MIAVTGATGALGGRVAARLAGAGVAQRLVVRDVARAPSLAGADIAVVSSYRDATGMTAALEGADTLFLVSGRESADRVTEHTAAVDAAVRAGVSRVVYVSFCGAAPDCTFTFGRDHWHTEQYIRGTGLRFTFLRDDFYLAMLPRLVGADGVIRGPAGNGAVAAVAHDDIADVAATVLAASDDSHDGRTYRLTGPEALTLEQVAAQLTASWGRPICYVAETVEEAYASRSGYGAPAFEVAGWVTSYTAIAAGDLAAVSGDVEAVTGRPPQNLQAWLASHPDSGRPRPLQEGLA